MSSTACSVPTLECWTKIWKGTIEAETVLCLQDENKEVAETIKEDKEYNARRCPYPGVLDRDMAR